VTIEPRQSLTNAFILNPDVAEAVAHGFFHRAASIMNCSVEVRGAPHARVTFSTLMFFPIAICAARPGRA
jgi:hypothetical protein